MTVRCEAYHPTTNAAINGTSPSNTVNFRACGTIIPYLSDAPGNFWGSGTGVVMFVRCRTKPSQQADLRPRANSIRHNYSCRSAINGSTDAARLAGSHAAAIAERAIMKTTTP